MSHAANPNTISTENRVWQHDGKRALLQTWEQQSIPIRIREKDYIKDLRKRTMQVRNYILHRADPLADILMPKTRKAGNDPND